MKNRFDVIVIGGGHAGAEAANICAKLEVDTLLLTSNFDNIAHYSCNPSIGGVAKGQIVQEIDMLGGIMGRVADRTYLQFKMLNLSKGAAVWSPRAQGDKVFYKNEIKNELLKLKNLTIYQAMVSAVEVENGKFSHVLTEFGQQFFAKACILCSGTFMKGRIFMGLTECKGGRDCDASSEGLSGSLTKAGIKLRRLKTGTPPRIKGKTVDFSAMEQQNGDKTAYHFSIFEKQKSNKNLPCFITRTNKKTHEVLQKGFKQSPLYQGVIHGRGPRYCPSIEDKIVRFSERESHQLFLEPESALLDEYYLNGFSSSLPENIVYDALRTIKGLENAEILKPAYGIEYDALESFQIKRTMETKIVKNLFCAGQINGTSGYEEAAAQGLIAGINAVAAIKSSEEFVLTRAEAYTGILTEDISSKEIIDPYRMFTSRAEHRLLLRFDNVDERLINKAKQFSLLTKDEQDEVCERISKKEKLVSYLSKTTVDIAKIDSILKRRGVETEIKGQRYFTYLKRPDAQIEDVFEAENIEEDYSKYEKIKAEIEIKYIGYIEKQKELVEKGLEFSDKKIPEAIKYYAIEGIPLEAKEKLDKIRPETISALSRIDGVTMADIQVIVYFLKKSGQI